MRSMFKTVLMYERSSFDIPPFYAHMRQQPLSNTLEKTGTSAAECHVKLRFLESRMYSCGVLFIMLSFRILLIGLGHNLN